MISVPETATFTFNCSWKTWTPITLADMKSSNWVIDFGIR